MKLVTLDVSDLAPPEPMQQILLALSGLTSDQCLQVIHRREPFPLYDKLPLAGWSYHTEQVKEQVFHIYIFAQSAQHQFMQMMSQ